MRVGKILFWILGSLLLLEGCFGIYYMISLKAVVSASTASKETLEGFQQPEFRTCLEKSIWAPLPHLGYGRSLDYRNTCPDGRAVVNNRGLAGGDFPEKRDPEKFTILLTGGSVAERLGVQKIGSVPFLEHLLNERYFPPKGSSFRLLNAAIADYRQPQNLISTILFHDIIDAVVDLAGYNEVTNYEKHSRLERISSLYWGLFLPEKLELIKAQVRFILADFETSVCRYSYMCLYSTEWKIRSKMKEFGQQRNFQPQREIDKFPPEISEEEAWDIRVNKHKGYLRLMNSVCETMDLRCSFFLQPFPGLHKKLTRLEKLKNSFETSELRTKNYGRLVKELVSVPDIPIHSLLKIYSHLPEQVYIDNVHVIQGKSEPSKAEKIMADAIVSALAKDWNLRRR